MCSTNEEFRDLPSSSGFGVRRWHELSSWCPGGQILRAELGDADRRQCDERRERPVHRREERYVRAGQVCRCSMGQGREGAATVERPQRKPGNSFLRATVVSSAYR